MGACCSAEAPDVVLADPSEPCQIALKYAGMFQGDDCYVHQNDENGPKWCFIDRDGSFFSAESKYFLMAFRSAVPGEKWSKANGDVLACGKGTFGGHQSYKLYNYDVAGSDSSDGYSMSSDFDSGRVVRQSMKWRAKTEVKIYKDRDMTVFIGTLKVKAKGKVIRRLEAATETRTRDDGSTYHEKVVRSHESKKVKKLKYSWLPNDDEMREVKIRLTGPFSNVKHPLAWSSPMFNAEMLGWWSPKPKCQVFGNNPIEVQVHMLLAYLCTISFTPKDLASNVPHVNWPGVHVPGYGYYNTF